MCFLILRILCLLAGILNLCTSSQTVNKRCTFVSVGTSETGTCYYVSKETLTWPDAHRFCHSNQGWLLNDVYEAISYFDPKITFNGIISMWSGHHVKNYRLLADDFPTVRLAGSFTNFTLNTTTGRSGCVLQVYDGTCKVSSRLTKRQAQAEGNVKQCEDPYTKVFAPCDQKHFFVCMFNVKFDFRSGFVHSQGSIQTIRSETLPVDFYTTDERVTFYEKDAACRRKLQNGQNFRASSDYERKMLLFFGKTSLLLGYINSRSERFWLDAGVDNCGAVTVGMSQFVYAAWPCNTCQRVLCEQNKVYNDTQPPKLHITATSPSVVVRGNEIQATSSLARQFDRVSAATADPFQSYVSIKCVTSIGPLQRVTLYNNGLPVSSHEGVPFTGFYFNLTVHENGYPTANVPAIDYNQYFHCVVNNLKDGSTQQSDFAFIRLTDYEVYSLHIDLVSNVMADTIAVVMLKASLLNRWTHQIYSVSANNLTLATLTPSIKTDWFLADLKSSLDEVVKPMTGWRIKLMLFMMSPNDRKSLVAYLYLNVSETQTIEDMNETKLELATRSITDLFRKSQNDLPQFNVTSVRVHSIDWCWPTTLPHITKDKYALPKSTIGTVWRSPNTCAQDRQPLVTVSCEGDKIVGLLWSRVRVNPLCDYSGNISGRTNVTNRLKEVAEGNITEVTIEEIVRDLVQIIQGADTSKVIPEDVRYLADIFQKSSDVSVKNLATVQGMLDIASLLRNFPDYVLTESQRLGNATNRILKSLDLLGGQVVISSERNEQRVISGGLGLEVWNLSRINDTAFVVGIKLSSGNKPEILTSDNLITLFKKEDVDYNRAEVAILLQQDSIADIVSNYTNSTIRLSLNIYTDTTLFRTSEIVNNNGSEPSLNSRVIAAQLLVDGLPVTNLSSNTVQIVFMPLKRTPTDLRPNLTICAFWEFEAESGAGGWSSEGCVYNQTIDGRDVCVCDHLTNFALLMNFYGQENLDNETLTIISIVGLSLSMLGLSLSILSFLLIKRVRRGHPQQTLFQLCVALLASWIVFLAGVNQTSSHAGCIVVAVLLHYLILSSFMWMLMEGILQYLLFVKVFNTYFSNYMWKTSLPAWGLPAIPVIIVLIIDPELYKGGDKYCWMSSTAFKYSFAIPVGLIVLTNIVIFVMVVISLCRREDMTKHTTNKQNQNVVNIRASFICFCVLGLSWIFGFLMVDNARTVFEYIFCISATLQGFVIFVMMTARDKHVRDFWWFKFRLSKLWWSRFYLRFTSPAKRGNYKIREKGCATKSSSSCDLDAVYSDESKSKDSDSRNRGSDNTISASVSNSVEAVTTPSL